MRDHSVELLNQLLAIEYRSLPLYLMDATPWTHPGDQAATVALRSVVKTQRSLAERIATLIGARGGAVDSGEYPMEFTDLNFLSLDYLLKELARCGQRQVAGIESIVDRLLDTEARELAQEVLGAEKAHIEMFQDLSSRVAA